MPKKKPVPTKRKSLFRRIIKLVSWLIFAMLALASIFILLIKAGFFGALPTDDALKNIKNNVATEIYSADKQLLGRFYIHERKPVKFDQLSPHLVNALVATEDARFYSHKGIDPRSLLRVILKTVVLQDRSGGGGSTLSQQLAKNLFPRTINTKFDIAITKIKEALIAFQLESLYSKNEILELYLNTVPFGENIYGVELAANRFFNKKAADLKIEEAAVLIGMLKANHTYNPRLFPEKSINRRNVVMAQMVKYDFLKQETYDTLKNIPLTINYQRVSATTGLATYFRNFIRPELEKWAEDNEKPDGGNYNLYADGLQIITTIDSHIQQHAEAAMARNMANLQQQFDRHWSGQKPWDSDANLIANAIKKLPAYQKMIKQGVNEKEAMQKLKTKHAVDVFTWNGMQEKELSTIDSLKHYMMLLQTGVVAMDPNNGQIKAWVGGIDFSRFQYDHVAQAKRQVGSTFKPFVYAAALEEGIDPCEYISASRVTYKNLEDWTPGNADDQENIMKYNFTGALAKSVNTVTVKLVEQVGIEDIISKAKQMGIDENLPENPSVGLGTANISLLEMTKAYCTFANGGKTVQPVFLKEIKDSNGTVLYTLTPPAPQLAIKKSTTQLINHMLQAVVDEGTASSARWKYKLPNQLAGKTGTTQSNTDGWFIGYNPKLVVGVWVGADDPKIRFRNTALGSGANMALPIFVGLFKDMNNDPALRGITEARFSPLPDDLQKLVACDNEKEDRNALQKLLGIEKKDKAKEKAFGEEAEKKGFLKKVGDLFKKKD